jgi:CP family cyanate transporter-like MFS transporter
VPRERRQGNGPAVVEDRTVRSSWLRLVLLWIAGVDMRLTLLAVPPVLPLVHRALGLTETGIALLASLPVVLFAVAAVPGSLLIARIGARSAVIAGMVLMAVTSGLRGTWTSIPVLFGMTALMSAGIAVAQPAIPSLVGEWLPKRVGLATAVYVNGILVGETLGAGLTLPVVLPLAGGRWEGSFALWGAFALATVLLMAWLSRGLPDATGDPDLEWSPDWKGAETWRLGLLLGGLTAAYFGANAFMPDFLRAIGRPHLIGTCLTVLNASQLPAPVVAGLIGSGTLGRREPFLITGMAILGGLGLFLWQHDWGLILGAGLLGFCFAFGLVLCLSLPPILSPRGAVHRLSGGMFAIAYVYSFAAQLLTGAAWDLSRVPATAFLPVGVGTATMLAAAMTLPSSG